MKYNYYEIEFSNNHDEKTSICLDTAMWMCIRGVRKPTIQEANLFCSEDSEMYGMPVTDVREIDESTARDCYDFCNEQNWHVFGV